MEISVFIIGLIALMLSTLLYLLTERSYRKRLPLLLFADLFVKESKPQDGPKYQQNYKGLKETFRFLIILSLLAMVASFFIN